MITFHHISWVFGLKNKKTLSQNQLLWPRREQIKLILAIKNKFEKKKNKRNPTGRVTRKRTKKDTTCIFLSFCLFFIFVCFFLVLFLWTPLYSLCCWTQQNQLPPVTWPSRGPSRRHGWAWQSTYPIEGWKIGLDYSKLVLYINIYIYCMIVILWYWSYRSKM